MNLYQAALYQMFAKGTQPKRSATYRVIFLVLATIALSVLICRLTPAGTVPHRPEWEVAAMVFASATLLTTLPYIVLDGYQKSFLQRLKVVYFLPLLRSQLRIVHGFAFMPLAIVATAFCLPIILKLFADFWLLAVGACLLALLWNSVVRITYAQWSRSLSILVSCVAGWAAWSLFAGWSSAEGLIGSGVLLLFEVVLLFVGSPRFTRVHEVVESRRVMERKRLTIVTSLGLRALRSGRFRGTNALLVVAFVGLALLASSRLDVVPYDAAVVVTIVLMGTLGQDIRGLIRHVYPLELVRFGLSGYLVSALWATTYAAAAAWLLVIGLATNGFSPGLLGVSWTYCICLTLCLIAGGLAASSAVAPQQGDLLAQLFSACLYAVLAWFVFRLFVWVDGAWQLWAAGGFVAGCFAFSLAVEKYRWLTTIRRKHGFIF